MNSNNPYIKWQNNNILESSNPLLYAGSNGVNDSTQYHKQTLKVLRDNGFNENHTILDYGCGTGALYMVLEKKLIDPDAQYFGNEMSIEAYEFLSKNFSINNLFLSEADLISGFTSQIFDFLVAFSVFNHIDINRFEKVIKNLHKNINSRSKFFFTVRLIDDSVSHPRGKLSKCGTFYSDRDLNFGYKTGAFFKILKTYDYGYKLIEKEKYYNKKVLGDLDLIVIYKNNLK